MTTLMALLIPTKFPLCLFFMPKREQICILREKHLEVTSFRRNFAPGKKDYINNFNGSLKFEITAKRLYAASQRVL